ncbi:hypothetical protein ACVIWU_006617 [Bradyrhizobium sp. USDA 4509]
MDVAKSLLLGSAAGLIALGGARAADLPVKAKPIEYVRICSLYGPGFYYVPGTDTCIKLGGYELLMKAVRKHVQDRWALLYIERRLTAPMQVEDGTGCLTA